MPTTQNTRAALLLPALLFATALFAALPAQAQAPEAPPPSAGETLYNGIILPDAWPPRYPANTRRPMPVPYLDTPPSVIPIDVGRQLFVDDFLIEHTNLTRTFHTPEYHPANPVLTFDRPWEVEGRWHVAAPFSDGVWWDPDRQKFVMWYLAGNINLTCYAESDDGIRWTKPQLDIEPGTNIVLRGRRDSSTVWRDAQADPDQRYKRLTYLPGHTLELRDSPDGIHWSPPRHQAPWRGDRTTFHHNPFRNVWVASLRTYPPRSRAYHEHADLPALLDTLPDDPPHWFGADHLDRRNPDFPEQTTQVYAHDAIAYESVMLGFFTVYMGPENDDAARLGIQKHNEVQVGFSRDGFHWHRPSREPFLGVDRSSDDTWNWGNVQSVGGNCLVVEDKLYFYASGRALNDVFWDGHISTGLATLRRDGFASMDHTPGSPDTPGTSDTPGTLTTRPLRTDHGRHLFVNADIAHGSLRAEILDESGNPIPPFTLDNCDPLTDDTTAARITWGDHHDLDALRGRTIRLRFELTHGSLYAFWISPDPSGKSHGYVAAGGPGLPGPRDN